MSKRILVVEDEADIRNLLVMHLERAGFAVDTNDGRDSLLPLLKSRHYDLILLDWMLPKSSGLEILHALRKDSKMIEIPVLMLTARALESDIVQGLEAGADDYVTKPFSAPVLMARVHGLLRRKSKSSQKSASFRFGAVEVDPKGCEVFVDGKPVALTASELKILLVLGNNSDKVMTRARLIEEVKGPNVSVVDRTVDNHILGLRKKLGPSADQIETIRGIGYRLHLGDGKESL